MDLYETVGVKRDATQAEIKKAYRKRARVLHPDHGGGEDEFKALGFAYEVLSDPERRARYDATGETSDRPTSEGSDEDQANSLIVETLDTILMKCSQEGVEPSAVKLIVTLLSALRTLRGQIEQANIDLAAQAAGNEKLAKRFTRKAGKDNRISPVFLRRAATQREHIELNVGKIRVVDLAIELGATYDFETEKPAPVFGWDLASGDSVSIVIGGRPFRA